MKKLLEMNGISKSFSTVKVLQDISFDLYAGEVHTLIGENGAGKSTLMKILMGLYTADSGEISVDSQKVVINSPAKARSLGIAMIHQELSPVLDMSVAENIFVGREISRFGIVDKAAQERQAAGFLKELGLDISAKTKMSQLSVSEIQMVEIAKTISSGAKIIIMDEPTSAITKVEVEKLFNAIRLLTQQGKSVIYISHKLEELFEISDRITVLRDGKKIDTLPIAEITKQMLIKKMVGREISDVYPQSTNTPSDVILSVRNLSRKNEFENISFDLHRGERLGIGGLMGAGRSELVMTIFGERKPTSGEILINGKTVHISSPKQAIAHGLALISEDRKKYGLNLMASVNDNIVAVIEQSISKFGIYNRSKSDKISSDMMKALNIKASSANQCVGSLSGGNQQKVVLAKWLNHDVDVVIFDEPTRGIDVGAKEEIYKIINSLAESGKAVIVISSEMPELIGLTDRIIVLHEGALEGELSKEKITQENIMQLASGS